MSEQIDERFQAQSEQMGSLQDTASTMGEQLDTIISILNSHTGSMVTQQKLNEETGRIATNNNQVQMSLTMLTARIERMERANAPSESFCPPETPNADEKHPTKVRSPSPPAESHKKRHKSLVT
eukprot:14842923-Ditylum_brightwellii.AAC.1